MFAGSASLTFHVALLAFALLLTGLRAVAPPPPPLTPIELFAPVVTPPAGGSPFGVTAGAAPRWGTFRWDFKIIDNHGRFSQHTLDWRGGINENDGSQIYRHIDAITRPSDDAPAP
jgi:hypothetical protein